MFQTNHNNQQANYDATEKSSLPRVFNYDSYRKFLGDWLEAKKTATPSYSGAVFAKQAGISSHTLLGMVIRAQRNLSHDTIRAFSKALEFSARESLFFEKLVLFNQVRNADDRRYYLEQLLSVSYGEGRKLFTKIRDHARYLGHWYVVAIREMVNLKDFRADPEWMARKLKNRITRKQAEEAWTLLLQLGLVMSEEGSSDRFEVVHKSLDIDPGQVDFAIRSFHREYLDRSRDALENEPMDQREFSSMTMSISSEDRAILRKRISEFRKNLNHDFPTNKALSREDLVAVNFQLLVLSDSVVRRQDTEKQGKAAIKSHEKCEERKRKGEANE